MTITEQLARAFADVIDTVAVLPDIVDHGIRSDEVDEWNNRVVVVGDSARLRHTSIPGLYDVTGRVIVQQSIDTDNALTSFQALTEEIRSIVNDKAGLPALLQAADSELRVHSDLFLSTETVQSERGFQAIFTWSSFAELPH